MSSDNKPPRRTWLRWILLGLPLGSVLAGLVGMALVVGFNSAVALTNTEAFCISCHAMRDTVYQEYQQLPHAKNASGVIASCPDCHVPKQFVAKMVRKVQASNELFHTLLGTIDTPEKFEARRKILAERVWASMKETDSRECRTCHSATHMALEAQTAQARKKHDPQRMAARGETCIDCHKGIAHQLPKDI